MRDKGDGLERGVGGGKRRGREWKRGGRKRLIGVGG